MTKDFTSIDPANLFPRRGDQAADATTRESDDAPEYSPPSLAPHVIVGCCLADLLPPDVLIRSLVRLAGGGGGDCDGGGLQAKEESGKHDCLVYLPITFVGKTEMIPSSPQVARIWMMCVVFFRFCVDDVIDIDPDGDIRRLDNFLHAPSAT